jgi:hypothetical protein
MTGESANSQKMLLAVAIAECTAVTKWASSNEVPEQTAYRWAAEPGVRSEFESIRRRATVFVKKSRIRGGLQPHVSSQNRIMPLSAEL